MSAFDELSKQSSGLKVFAVSSADLSRYDNWSVEFHRMMQLADGPMDQRLAAFWEWLRYLNISPGRIESILRDSADEDAAVAEVTKIVLKRCDAGRAKLTPEDAVRVRGLVKSLADHYATRVQAEIDARTSQLGTLRKKYSLEASQLVAGLLR